MMFCGSTVKQCLQVQSNLSEKPNSSTNNKIIMRKLASIQTIRKINDIPNADKIQCATILGWQCVVKKEQFKEGDRVIFIEIDSVLPVAPWSEFLRDPKNPDKPIRVRTAKFRGQISQGLVIGTEWVPMGTLLEEGSDVTETLGITKYEPPETRESAQARIAGDIAGEFPGILRKTDETRIQSVPGVIARHSDKMFVATEKLDGCSATFYSYNGQFGVCSRNYEIKAYDASGNTNIYWRMAVKYHILQILLKAGNVCAQGEIVGPGIQKNRLRLDTVQLFIFNLFNINTQSYYPDNYMRDFCAMNNLSAVPLFRHGVLFNPTTTVESLVEMATGKSALNPKCDREGLVFRPITEGIDFELGRLSFKVINPNYLLQHGE